MRGEGVPVFLLRAGDGLIVRFVSVTAADEKINNVAAFVLEAIEGFPGKVNGTTKCDSVVCNSRKLWKYVDKRMGDKK